MQDTQTSNNLKLISKNTIQVLCLYHVSVFHPKDTKMCKFSQQAFVMLLSMLHSLS